MSAKQSRTVFDPDIEALRAVLVAIEDLTFAQQVRVLSVASSWAGIDPTKLTALPAGAVR